MPVVILYCTGVSTVRLLHAYTQPVRNLLHLAIFMSLGEDAFVHNCSSRFLVTFYVCV
jgi:hypothetical protein